MENQQDANLFQDKSTSSQGSYNCTVYLVDLEEAEFSRPSFIFSFNYALSCFTTACHKNLNKFAVLLGLLLKKVLVSVDLGLQP